MKKSIPNVWERESEASILGNDREREFPLTPVSGLESLSLNGDIQCSSLKSFALVDVDVNC